MARSRKKAHLIYNGIATPKFLSRTEAKERIGKMVGVNIVPSGAIIIGIIAELTNNKGLEFAIGAMEDLPSCILIIMGRGEMENELKKQIETGGLEKRVFLAGFVQGAATLISGFDIFLLPSIKEGLPYVILEAGLAGLPVVASDVGSIGEIIESGLSGTLVTPRQPEEIKKAIDVLIKNPEIGKKFGINLQKNVREKFGFEKMIKKTMAVYSDKR